MSLIVLACNCPPPAAPIIIDSALCCSRCQEPMTLGVARTTVEDPWLSVVDAAKELGIKARIITDEAKRGRITIGHASRKPMVRRSELDRWIASRPSTVKQTVSDDADQVLPFNRAAARLRRAG